MLRNHQPMINGLSLLLLLLAARMLWHGNLRFAFIPWNLFLAAVPLLFSYGVTRARAKSVRWLSAALWLLFFPNSAYLITDIVHLQVRPGTAFWLDLVLLFGAGLYGIILGLQSLRRIEAWYVKMLPARVAPILTAGLLIISGYGIYLGRVERWNSWDILFSTGDLIAAIAYEVRHPLRCIETWMLSGIFAAALGLSYFALGRKTDSDGELGMRRTEGDRAL